MGVKLKIRSGGLDLVYKCKIRFGLEINLVWIWSENMKTEYNMV